jgi:pimeloyl-ACP methyl ester carboxylesterase
MPAGPTATSDEIAGLERGYFALPGGTASKVSYLRAGDPDGRRVIFVHGSPGEAGGWADYLLHVPPGFEYIAIDRPGFGASNPDDAEPSLKRQAAALAPLLQQRLGKWPILVGHSLGGPIIARAAADQPGRIDALLILAGSFDPKLERVHPMQPVGEWWGVRDMLPRHLRNANRELLTLKGELDILQPRLQTLTLPMTIIHGTNDTLVRIENVAFMRRHLAGTKPLTVELLPEQGHFIPWERRDTIERALTVLARR